MNAIETPGGKLCKDWRWPYIYKGVAFRNVIPFDIYMPGVRAKRVKMCKECFLGSKQMEKCKNIDQIFALIDDRKFLNTKEIWGNKRTIEICLKENNNLLILY